MAVAQMDLINDAYNRTGIFENDKKYQGYRAVASFIQKPVRLWFLRIQTFSLWMI